MIQPDSAAIPCVASDSCSYPARPGNLVRPLVDGVPAFQRIAAAIEAAQHSVWLTVAFVATDFQMPGGRGSLFDMLDRAAARGLDVRVIFWRPNPESAGYGRTFPGSPADRDLLRDRGSQFHIRWDRAHGAYCQHQKSWLVDAGHPSEIAFVGGINLTRFAIGIPGHAGEDQRHDLYAEIAGPSATDVHHNFVQRWNEASERLAEDGIWGDAGALPFPHAVSAPRGASFVQIQRTVHEGRYSNSHPTPAGHSYDIAGGERSVLAQYLLAIDAATSSIYIENQSIPILDVATRLEAALKRGVALVMLLPADPEDSVRAARRKPENQSWFAQLAEFGQYQNFALVGIAGRNTQSGRSTVYVHGKTMLVDDAWATIGSCNLHRSSLFGSTEMNASIWDPAMVRALRCELLAEHLGQDTSSLDDRTALQLYRRIAQNNAIRHSKGDSNWQGIAFTLDPTQYGA